MKSKYFNTFSTKAEYDNYMGGSEVGYPNVGAIEADGSVSYIEDEELYYTKQYLTFEALESGTFTLTIGAYHYTQYLTSVSYSIDNGQTWVTTNNTNSKVTITTPTINKGDKVLWKGLGSCMSSSESSNRHSTFSSTCTFNVKGNIMSLLYGDEFYNIVPVYDDYTYYAFGYLFEGSSVIDASKLILSYIITASCFSNMFKNCTSLTAAPKLPFTTLYRGCYNSMFYGCTSLTTAPELPATTLINNCYYNMFYKCSSLNYVKCLATEFAMMSTDSWLYNVSATGTFVKPTNTTYSTGTSGIPSGWTIVNI